MTKQEAKIAMREGKKVTHSPSFTDEEWITMRGLDTIVMEDGYTASERDFWKYRNHPNFEVDWEIFKEE